VAWRIEKQPTPPRGELAILSVLNCHEAWRRLTPIQRYYLTAAGPDNRLPPMHGNTRRALVAHGICDEDGTLTPAGRDVRRWRPMKTATETVSTVLDEPGEG
jgi:hypothetical protein